MCCHVPKQSSVRVRFTRARSVRTQSAFALLFVCLSRMTETKKKKKKNKQHEGMTISCMISYVSRNPTWHCRRCTKVAVLLARDGLRKSIRECDRSAGDSQRCDQVCRHLDSSSIAAPLCFRWYAKRSSEDVIRQRESTIRWIEERGQQFWCASHYHVVTFATTTLCRQDGECEKWSSYASQEIKALAREVNAPLLAFLAEYINEGDADCIDFFRYGALHIAGP